MCIVFIYSGCKDTISDYSLILAANRDEFYDRPAKTAAAWSEDPSVFGGRDLVSGGTWMAISPQGKKLALLLNLPGHNKNNAKSRGKIVEDFVKNNYNVEQYVESLKMYAHETNDFNFVTVSFGKSTNEVHIYNNNTDELEKRTDTYIGFSNSLTDTPLKKVDAGLDKFKDICTRLSKSNLKEKLMEELVSLMKWNKRHLPDAELQRRNPRKHEELSSVFVTIPEVRYGTRTHSFVLVTKTGHVDFIEITMQPTANILDANWEKSEFHFEI